jgi:hypothetical protein
VLPRLDTRLLFPSPSDRQSTSTTSSARTGACGDDGRDRDTGADLRPRSTFASNAFAAGVTVFELARVMGTSVRMIKRHYGVLLDGAHNLIASRLDAFEAEQEQTERGT